MKNTITQLKAFLCFFVLAMFSFNFSSAQSWDYVNFTDSSNISLDNACIDGSDNVYTYGNDVSWTRALRKFDASGNLSWTKDVSALIDYAGNGTQNGGIGGLEYKNSKVYLVGKKSNNGVIIESSVSSGVLPTTWDQLSSSQYNEIYDISIEGNYMYVVGHFSNTLSFFDGTTLSGSTGSTFIAKYSIAPKQLVWAKKVESSSYINGYNIDADGSGNVFISGHFRGNASFYNGTTPYTYTSSSSTSHGDAFLAKFDSNGNFSNTFGLKVDPYLPDGNFKRSYDVKVSDTNDAVYWAEYVKVLAYQASGSGNHLWTKILPNSSKANDIEVNNCGDVYVTGQAYGPVNKSGAKAPCGGDFFGISLDASTGSTVWPENSSSCSSYGSEIVIDSNNKEVFVGSYFSSGGSQPLIIDTFSSGNSRGYFIGRYTDAPVNSCCSATLEVGKSKVICDGDPFPVLDITGQIPNIVSINWYLNGNPFPQPVNAQTITTFAAGTYSVVVVYDNGCTLTDAMTLVVNDCPAECEVTPKFDVKTKYCTASFANNSYASGGTTIAGYLWDFGDGTTSTDANPTHTYQVGGSYIVTLSIYGVNADGDCCVKQIQRKIYIKVSCLPKCGVYPKFQISNVGNGVALFESTSTANGATTIVGYEWTLNGTVVSNNQYFAQPFSGGALCLTVYGLTAKGECCSETVCKEFKSTKEEDVLEDQFKIYPNPTQNDINFDFSTLDNARALKEIAVIDVNGRILVAKETNDTKYKVQTQDWPTGLYLCKVTIDGITTTKKIIKN